MRLVVTSETREKLLLSTAQLHHHTADMQAMCDDVRQWRVQYSFLYHPPRRSHNLWPPQYCDWRPRVSGQTCVELETTLEGLEAALTPFKHSRNNFRVCYYVCNRVNTPLMFNFRPYKMNILIRWPVHFSPNIEKYLIPPELGWLHICPCLCKSPPVQCPAQPRPLIKCLCKPRQVAKHGRSWPLGVSGRKLDLLLLTTTFFSFAL